MGKRILSFLLALVMVVGLIPATVFPVFAAETNSAETPTANVYAAYADNIAVDGVLSEAGWLTYGKMTAVESAAKRNFGVLFDAGYLYFGVDSADSVSVQINGKTVTPAANVAGTAAREVAVALTDIVGLSGSAVSVVLQSGNYSWSGTVSLKRMNEVPLISASLSRGLVQVWLM